MLITVTQLLFVYINPPSATGQAVRLAVISCQMPSTWLSTLFIFQVVKLSLCEATGKHPYKYEWKVKAFIFQGLPCLLQAVTKISTV